MKILLITPLFSQVKSRWMPLGLSYISSTLKQHGHQVRLFDRFLEGLRLGEKALVDQAMKQEIVKYQPDLIGFSTVSEAIYDTIECIGYIRGFFDKTIIAGGHHITALPLLSLNRIPGLDYAAIGEGELSLLSLASGEKPQNIRGIVTRESNSLNLEYSRIKNLDALPLPDYSIFNMDYYTQSNASTIRGFYLRTACMLTSRGCPFSCKFCSESLNFGKGVRFHSPDYVIENMEKLVTDYNVQGLYFHDNNFLYSRTHLEDICRRIIKKDLNKKVKWAIQGSSAFINEDILKILSEAGCIKIELGIESVEESSLKSMNKSSSIALNQKALKLCRKYNINTHGYFMTGFEGETISDLNNTLAWIKKFRPDTISLHPLKVYPGTVLYQDIGSSFFENHEWTQENINNYFNQDSLSNINIDDRRKWYKAYRTFNTWHHRRNLLKSNSLKTVLVLAFKKFFPY